MVSGFGAMRLRAKFTKGYNKTKLLNSNMPAGEKPRCATSPMPICRILVPPNRLGCRTTRLNGNSVVELMERSLHLPAESYVFNSPTTASRQNRCRDVPDRLSHHNSPAIVFGLSGFRCGQDATGDDCRTRPYLRLAGDRSACQPGTFIPPGVGRLGLYHLHDIRPS